MHRWGVWAIRATSSWRDEGVEKNVSKQSSGVEKRHRAWREMLGKMAGVREGADVQQERKHMNAGQHRGYPQTLCGARELF